MALDTLTPSQLAALRQLCARLGVEQARRTTGLDRHTFARARRGGRLQARTREAIREACERGAPPKPVLTCPHCGKEFERGPVPTQRYCSLSCQHAANVRLYQQRRRPVHPPRPCGHCAATFVPTHGNHRHCSAACRIKAQVASRKARKPPLPASRVCEWCTGAFVPVRPRQTCCSQTCVVKRCNERLNDRRRSYATPRGTRPPHPPRTCPTCENSFVPPHGNRIYCSPKCQRRAT